MSNPECECGHPSDEHGEHGTCKHLLCACAWDLVKFLTKQKIR